MPATSQNISPNGAQELRTLASQVGMLPAMNALLTHRDEHAPGANPRFWAAVNFDLHSREPRLFLFDRAENDVSAYLCAHGRGSDPRHSGVASKFANFDGSNCTCLGVFRTGQTYYGGHGYSLYLHGESPTNYNALRRHIVMHSATYVTPAHLQRYGKAGRSLGCPAVGPESSMNLIDALRGGSYLIHWSAQL